jgi:CBS domain-containing protein
MAMDEEIDRALSEENPGPSDLESALLHETLADVPSHSPAVLDTDATLDDAIRRMREHRRGVLLLVHDNKLAGIFTERDVLMKIVGTKIDTSRTLASDYMTRDPVTLPADAGVAFALNMMITEGFRHIPLVDQAERPVGVVSMRDIIEYLSNFFQRDILNLPPSPEAPTRKRDGA